MPFNVYDPEFAERIEKEERDSRQTVLFFKNLGAKSSPIDKLVEQVRVN